MVTIDVIDMDVIVKYTVLLLEDNDLNFKKVRIDGVVYDVLPVMDTKRCCIAIDMVLDKKPNQIEVVEDPK